VPIHWSLVFARHQGMLILLRNGFPAPAFALMRPLELFCVAVEQLIKMCNINQHCCRVSYSLLGLIVWSVKLVLLERYQFMDKIGAEKIGNPRMMIVWAV
jgi:hypothetical protein